MFNRIQDAEKVYTVNEYLKIGLDKEEIKIFINDKFFNEPDNFLFGIYLNKTKYEDLLGIIDDHDKNTQLLSLETEFWGLCENFRTWYELDYDCRLLGPELAFPVLKKLYKAGDPLAKQVFKREVVKRAQEGDEYTREFILYEPTLTLFTVEELVTIQTTVAPVHKNHTKLLRDYIRYRTEGPEYNEQLIRYFVHFLLHVPEGTYTLNDLRVYPRFKALATLQFIADKVENPKDPFISRSKIELKMDNQKKFTLVHSPLAHTFTHVQRVGFHLYSSWTKRGTIYKEWMTDEILEQMGKLFYKIGYDSYELTPDGLYMIETIEELISKILDGTLTIKKALKRLNNPHTFVRENIYPIDPKIPQETYSIEVIDPWSSRIFGLHRLT